MPIVSNSPVFLKDEEMMASSDVAWDSTGGSDMSVRADAGIRMHACMHACMYVQVMQNRIGRPGWPRMRTHQGD